MLRNDLSEGINVHSPDRQKKGVIRGLKRKALPPAPLPRKTDTEPKPRFVVPMHSELPQKRQRPEQYFWKREEAEKLEALLYSGATYEEAAAQLNKSEMACRIKHSKLLRRTRPYNPWTPYEEKLVLEMREAGATWAETGDALGRKKDAVRTHFRKMMESKKC